jgi:hypothetical protein
MGFQKAPNSIKKHGLKLKKLAADGGSWHSPRASRELVMMLWRMFHRTWNGENMLKPPETHRIPQISYFLALSGKESLWPSQKLDLRMRFSCQGTMLSLVLVAEKAVAWIIEDMKLILGASWDHDKTGQTVLARNSSGAIHQGIDQGFGVANH